MHFLKLLLTKAENKKEVLDKARTFLEDYHNNVYDWYQFGGRWSNRLGPIDKMKEFQKWAKETYSEIFKNGGYRAKDIEAEPVKSELQNKWEEIGLRGKNIYSDPWGLKITDEDLLEGYDIMPLEEVVDRVKQYAPDREKRIKEQWGRIEEAMKKYFEGKTKYFPSYEFRIMADFTSTDFTSETTIYNIDDYMGDSEAIPEDLEGWWVIVADLHN